MARYVLLMHRRSKTDTAVVGVPRDGQDGERLAAAVVAAIPDPSEHAALAQLAELPVIAAISGDWLYLATAQMSEDRDSVITGVRRVSLEPATARITLATRTIWGTQTAKTVARWKFAFEDGAPLEFDADSAERDGAYEFAQDLARRLGWTSPSKAFVAVR